MTINEREEMMKPQRIQRRRTKGWRMPENTVSVCRPGKWGNPFKMVGLKCGCWEVVDENDVTYLLDMRHHPEGKHEPVTTQRYAAREATDLFRSLFTGHRVFQEREVEDLLDLQGKNLACFCPPDQPCHGDVLLELANQ